MAIKPLRLKEMNCQDVKINLFLDMYILQIYK